MIKWWRGCQGQPLFNCSEREGWWTSIPGCSLGSEETWAELWKKKRTERRQTGTAFAVVERWVLAVLSPLATFQVGTLLWVQMWPNFCKMTEPWTQDQVSLVTEARTFRCVFCSEIQSYIALYSRSPPSLCDVRWNCTTDSPIPASWELNYRHLPLGSLFFFSMQCWGWNASMLSKHSASQAAPPGQSLLFWNARSSQ